MAKKSKTKRKPQATPLRDSELDQVDGGGVKVTSYSISGAGLDDGTTTGGGPHVRVFSGQDGG